jgi:hypothetical protein
MGRTWALRLAAASLLLGATGCSQSGSYRLSWVFLVVDASTKTTEGTAAGCGQHGVDSILANGTDGSDSVRIIAQCVPGSFSGTAPPGSWTFTFQMLDAGGGLVRPINPPLNSPNAMPPQPSVTVGPLSIATGAPATEFAAQLTPPSVCNDGIDNDSDGLVDTGSECGDAGAPSAQDGGASKDAAQADGAQTDGAQTDAAQREGGAGARDAGAQDGAGLDARG